MNKKLWIWVIVGLIALIVAYWLTSPLWRVVEADDDSPIISDDTGVLITETSVISQANLVPSAHDVEGRVLLIDEHDLNKKILRFEDFETVNGPDLFIYLSADLEANDFVNLGEIKATKGNVNYEIPEGTDLTKYNKVLIWCRAFRVLFSYADLS